MKMFSFNLPWRLINGNMEHQSLAFVFSVFSSLTSSSSLAIPTKQNQFGMQAIVSVIQ